MPMPKTSDYPLQTKRMVIGHVLVCHGCCCGDVDRGKPEVPVDWLKQEWRKRGLLKNIQLSICGCLGPCDLANVVKEMCIRDRAASWTGRNTKSSTIMATKKTRSTAWISSLPQRIR